MKARVGLLVVVTMVGLCASLLGAPHAEAAELTGFETVEIDGKPVPKNLPGLSMFALLTMAQPWRADAKPIILEVRERGRRYPGFEVVLNFASPSDRSGLIFLVRSPGISRLDVENARWGNLPYPPRFIDLPDIVKAAHRAGIKGALKSAMLKVYERSGPAWQLRFEGPKGATFSAVTGKRILGDVTGYIDDYNKQWNQAMAGIRGLAGTAYSVFSPKDPKKYWKEYEKFTCEVTNGGHWSFGSCH